MKKKDKKLNGTKKEPKIKMEKNFPGYPKYPKREDLYNKNKEEKELNPEDISKAKTPNEKKGTRNEKDFEEDMSGDDLDVQVQNWMIYKKI